MHPDLLRNFLWIQYARGATALAIVAGMVAAGFLGRSPSVVLLVTPLFTALYVLGKWTSWTAAWQLGGGRRVLGGIAITLPIQAVVAGIFYLIGLGLGRLFGRDAPAADLTAGDAIAVLVAFALCVLASVLIIKSEAHLRQQAIAKPSQKSEVKTAAESTRNTSMSTEPADTDITSTLNPESGKVTGRIYFPGNPWPMGHRVVSCKFSASIYPSVGAYAENYPNAGPGLMLEFELVTADYDEDDPTDRQGDELDAGESDWTSKIVWNNYHSCRIGPSQSSQVSGIRVSDGRTPFVFDLPEYRFSVDPLPINWDNFYETAAFGIYLLGHDSVAGHDIHLHSRQPDGSYTLDWTGKIALTYSGGDAFEPEFKASMTGVRFDLLTLFYFDVGRAKEYYDIDIDPNQSARDYIAPFVADPDNFTFQTRVDGLNRAVVYGYRKPA